MTRRGFVVALLVLEAGSRAAAEDLHDRAIRLHKSAISVDSHEDVPERLGKEWVDIGVRGKTGHVDIPRLKEGGVTAPFFAAYVPAAFATSGGAARKTLELIDLIHRLVEAHPNDLVLADSVAGIRSSQGSGKIVTLLG